MSTRLVRTPTSFLRFGMARVEITPPVGIYHRMWGAARHDRAAGVHRPLTAEVMVFAPRAGDEPPFVRVQLDLVGLAAGQVARLKAAVSGAAGVAAERVALCFSHSHSAGLFMPNRTELPGGELIAGYLAELEGKLADAAARAAAGVREATVTYATGRCAMNANRDYWDEEFGGHVCGFNPDEPADDTVVVARVTDERGEILATVVNYSCHPTTLAWENELLSPDYVGGLREVVERETGAPCVFALGACGEIGPRRGFMGDPAEADRNGRQVAYAALSALEGMPSPGKDFGYLGPVISGATVGPWAEGPPDAEHAARAARFRAGSFTVDLPLKELPTDEELAAAVARWEASWREAEAAGDALAARDARARAERARRWMGRMADLPPGKSFPVRYAVMRAGDAVWVTCAGEPYSAIQSELRRRFPEDVVLFTPIAGELQVTYLLPRDRYGKGLYQEEPSLLAPGCLERLTDAVSEQIAGM